jgi:NAD(P)-dependent dehydrogenase (short-subunit alcohol dehydrogenase family)
MGRVRALKGGWGTPAEMAAFAAFIFTDASESMTGATLLVDGGATAAMGRHLRGKRRTE